MKKLTKKQHRAVIKKSIEENQSVNALRCIQSVAEILNNVEDYYVLQAVVELTDLIAASRDNECYVNLSDADWDKVFIIDKLLRMENTKYLSFVATLIEKMSN